jgi:hypothetical protein
MNNERITYFRAEEIQNCNGTRHYTWEPSGHGG